MMVTIFFLHDGFLTGHNSQHQKISQHFLLLFFVFRFFKLAKQRCLLSSITKDTEKVTSN
jgi:hypothetical protein